MALATAGRPTVLRLLLALLGMLAQCPAAVLAQGCPKADYDVCVVGAGGSGMYAAWRLSGQGLRVQVSAVRLGSTAASRRDSLTT